MRARRALTIADAPALGAAERRAKVLRTTLLAALAILLGAAIMLAGRSKAATRVPVVVSTGPTTEVVLDVSGSVGDATYGFTERTLTAISKSGSVGLIVFSDTAEEALPPGTPGEELLPVARLFHPLRHRQPARYPVLNSHYPLSPWYASFSGGTKMSAGIAAAHEALRRAHVKGRVVLISDLGDAPDDLRALRTQLVSLARSGIELRVLPLPNTFPKDMNRFRQLEGPQVANAPLPPPRRAAPARQSVALPITLAAVAILLALALAANELYGISLRWKDPQ
jgi:hypothetical protein